MDERVKDYFKLDRAASVWWFPEREPIYRRQLDDLLAVINPYGKVVVDVGTGRGRFAIACAKAGASHVIGLDISARMLEIARTNARAAGCAERISFVRADAEQLPLRGGTVDIANCLELFVHLPDPRRAWVEMLSVTRLGGEVVANTDFPISGTPLFVTLYGLHALRYNPRKVLAAVRGRLRIGRPEARLHQRATLAETIEAVQRLPDAAFTRPEDSIARLPRDEFLRLLTHVAVEVHREVPCGFRWLPHGVIVIGRRIAALERASDPA